MSFVFVLVKLTFKLDLAGSTRAMSDIGIANVTGSDRAEGQRKGWHFCRVRHGHSFLYRIQIEL